MTKRNAGLVTIFILAGITAIPNCFSQLLKSPEGQERKAGETSTINWGDKAQAEQLAGHVTAEPRIVATQSGQGANAAILAVLRQKKAAGQFTGGVRPSEFTGGVKPGEFAGGVRTAGPGSSQTGMLNGNHTMLLSPSAPVSGSVSPSQVNSATGTAGVGTMPTPTAVNLQPGPTRQQPPGHNTPLTNRIGVVQPITAICMNSGISAVDKAKSGAVFSPGYSYAIQGCGFGTTPGQIYLTGIRNQNISNGSITQAPSPLHSDWMKLLVAPGKWSDSAIEAVVDPTTSGFYDSPNATLRIITSDNRTLWSPGFRFFATRASQTLASIPKGLAIYYPTSPTTVSLSGGNNFAPAHVTDSAGHPVQANFLSPSAASLVLPGHTFAVVRDDNSAPFPASTDTLDLTSAIEPNGFAITSVQPFYANLPQQACPSKFSSSGNWNPLITGVDKVNISWQEQSCGSNGVSAYAFDVIVEGPIGVSAF